MSQAQWVWGIQLLGVQVAQRIWKGLDQLTEVLDMGENIGENPNVMADIRFAYGVAERICVGNKRRSGGTLLDKTGEDREGALVYGTRDTDPHSGIHPGRVLDWDRLLESDHKPADGQHRSENSESRNSHPRILCGLDRTGDWDSVGGSGGVMEEGKSTVVELKNPGLGEEMAEWVTDDAFPSVSSWRKKLAWVARSQHLTFRSFLKAVCGNWDRWLIEPNHLLEVHHRIRRSTVRTQRKNGADDFHHYRAGYAMWSRWCSFGSKEVGLLTKASPGQSPSRVHADEWFRTELYHERGSQ